MEFSQLAREQLPCSLRRTVEAGGHFECLCNTSMASTHPQPIGVHICKILPITTFRKPMRISLLKLNFVT